MSHILRLPTELLQSIAEYSVDLTTLRLVCSAFNAAFFDAFGRLYLSEVHCFVLDKTRIARTNNMLLTPHLTRHVKQVTLSLDPLEGKESKDIPVALLPHFEDQFEIGQLLARMCMLESKFEPYMQREPPVEAIATLLHNLRRTASPYLVLDCRLPTLGISLDLRQTIEANADEITLNVLQMLCLARCNLSELRVNRTAFLDRFVEGRGLRNGLRQYCKSLQVLSYEADLSDLNRVFGNQYQNEPPQLLSEWALFTVLQGATSLRQLDLFGPLDPRRVRSKTGMDYAANVLPTHCSLHLRKVNLSAMQCDVESMWQALHNWKGTLQDLTLDKVSLETEEGSPLGQGWMKTFETLLRCSQLSELHLNVLYERNCSGDDGPSLDLREAHHCQVMEKLDIYHTVAIQRTLRLNLEAGCTFSYKIKA